MSTGMTTTTIGTLMIRVEHFLTAYMTRRHIVRTQRFTFAVTQTETKIILSSSPLNLHFSCWLMLQRNAKWSSGRWLVWSGYFMIQNTRIMLTVEEGLILTMLEKSTPPFITVTTAVRIYYIVLQWFAKIVETLVVKRATSSTPPINVVWISGSHPNNNIERGRGVTINVIVHSFNGVMLF